MRADIVIGANFGDEGKGLITDYLASRHTSCLVIRHNSGAQAGHTVTLTDGRRHVFGHIGAGSFAGASTYLSRHYVCNPLLFKKEYQSLSRIMSVPRVYVDQRALISTPYDMIINQLVEESRGAKRHGSCGVGFGETIERNLHPAYSLTIADLHDLESFLQKLMTIRLEWLPKRLLALGIYHIPPVWQERINHRDLLTDYIDATGFFLRTTRQTQGMPTGYNHVVCEGAQGLLLDQDHPWFPHVTRSYTGIRNAMDILQEAGITQAHVTYITRAYTTRHGAGPLPAELADKPYTAIHDETNLTNAFQGPLRFAWLDIDRVANAIQHDLTHVPKTMNVTSGLAVTCMDQIVGPASFVQNGMIHQAMPDILLDRLYTATKATTQLASYGPCRDHVRDLSCPSRKHLIATG
jgi:adenylosuccinate synthase